MEILEDHARAALSHLESCDLCPGIAIREMHRLVRGLMLDEDGIPDQGILFRHLPPVARGG